MSRPNQILFLNVDGVCNTHGGKYYGGLDPHLVENLNGIVSQYQHPVEVVFNTAWNINTIDKMRALFSKAGFRYPARLVGQTNSTQGGGDPIRDYLISTDQVGTPYLIIDDTTKDYGEMWCRLIHVDGTIGLDKKAMKRAYDILWQVPEEQRERSRAVNHVMTECKRIAWKTPWLQEDQREDLLRQALDLLHHFLLTPNFLEAAFLLPAQNRGSKSGMPP